MSWRYLSITEWQSLQKDLRLRYFYWYSTFIVALSRPIQFMQRYDSHHYRIFAFVLFRNNFWLTSHLNSAIINLKFTNIILLFKVWWVGVNQKIQTTQINLSTGSTESINAQTKNNFCGLWINVIIGVLLYFVVFTKTKECKFGIHAKNCSNRLC